MKSRVIVASILIPLLLALTLIAPAWLFMLALAAVSALIAYEFMRGAGMGREIRSVVYTVLFAAGVPVWVYLGADTDILYASFFVLTFLIFLEAVLSFRGESRVVLKLLATLFAAVIIPLMFVSVLSIRLFENGVFLVLLPFAVAYCSDTGAFFTGRALGKKKLIPYVSPNKTVAGAWGGIFGSVVGMIIYGLIIRFACGLTVSFPLLLLYGVVGSPVAQLGDLAFSLMKREFKIKDYGNLLPGHGGMLDRVDSVIFTAPLVYCLILWLPAIGV